MNTSATPLSSKSTDLLMAIINNPNQNAVEISKVLGVSVSTVTGSLSGLKSRGLVSVKDGALVATEEAEFEYGSPATTTTATTSASAFPTFGAAKGVLVETSTESEIDVADLTADAEEPTMEAGASEQPEITAGSVLIGGVAPKTVKVVAPNKTALAKKVYDENPGLSRAELMKLFMSDPINLSSHGANTYLYNFRNAAGLVKRRGAPAATAETTEATAETTTSDDTAA